MKKVFLSLIALLVAFTCVSCKNTTTTFANQISELTDNCYVGTSDTYTATIMTGTKETDFVINGSSGTKSDYTLITIMPTSPVVKKTFTYDVMLNSVDYKGSFVAHPFDGSYSANISVRCSKEPQIQLGVSEGDNNAVISCVSQVASDMINSDRAFDIAYNKLKPQVDTMMVDGKLNAEIYIRFMVNPIDNNSGYNWYIAFVGKDDVTYAVLLDPKSEQILAERTQG